MDTNSPQPEPKSLGQKHILGTFQAPDAGTFQAPDAGTFQGGSSKSSNPLASHSVCVI